MATGFEVDYSRSFIVRDGFAFLTVVFSDTTSDYQWLSYRAYNVVDGYMTPFGGRSIKIPPHSPGYTVEFYTGYPSKALEVWYKDPSNNIVVDKSKLMVDEPPSWFVEKYAPDYEEKGSGDVRIRSTETFVKDNTPMARLKVEIHLSSMADAKYVAGKVHIKVLDPHGKEIPITRMYYKCVDRSAYPPPTWVVERDPTKPLWLLAGDRWPYYIEFPLTDKGYYRVVLVIGGRTVYADSTYITPPEVKPPEEKPPEKPPEEEKKPLFYIDYENSFAVEDATTYLVVTFTDSTTGNPILDVAYRDMHTGSKLGLTLKVPPHESGESVAFLLPFSDYYKLRYARGYVWTEEVDMSKLKVLKEPPSWFVEKYKSNIERARVIVGKGSYGGGFVGNIARLEFSVGLSGSPIAPARIVIETPDGRVLNMFDFYYHYYTGFKKKNPSNLWLGLMGAQARADIPNGPEGTYTVKAYIGDRLTDTISITISKAPPTAPPPAKPTPVIEASIRKVLEAFPTGVEVTVAFGKVIGKHNIQVRVRDVFGRENVVEDTVDDTIAFKEKKYTMPYVPVDKVVLTEGDVVLDQTSEVEKKYPPGVDVLVDILRTIMKISRGGGS